MRLWRSFRISFLPYKLWIHLLLVAYPMPSALLFSSSEALTAFGGIFPLLRVSSLRCWRGGTNWRSVFPLLFYFYRWWDDSVESAPFSYCRAIPKGFLRCVFVVCYSRCCFCSGASTALCLRSGFLSAPLDRRNNTERKEGLEWGGVRTGVDVQDTGRCLLPREVSRGFEEFQ